MGATTARFFNVRPRRVKGENRWVTRQLLVWRVLLQARPADGNGWAAMHSDFGPGARACGVSRQNVAVSGTDNFFHRAALVIIGQARWL